MVYFPCIKSLGDILFQFGNNLRRGTGSIFRFKLKAIPYSWIVAGGNDNTPAGFLCQDTIAYDLRWSCSGAEVYLYPIAGNYFSSG